MCFDMICLYNRREYKNDKIVGSEVCFIKGGSEYCITGGDGGLASGTNQDTLNTAFPGECEGGTNYSCASGSWHVYSYGSGLAAVDGGSGNCRVGSDGEANCCYSD